MLAATRDIVPVASTVLIQGLDRYQLDVCRFKSGPAYRI